MSDLVIQYKDSEFPIQM